MESETSSDEHTVNEVRETLSKAVEQLLAPRRGRSSAPPGGCSHFLHKGFCRFLPRCTSLHPLRPYACDSSELGQLCVVLSQTSTLLSDAFSFKSLLNALHVSLSLLPPVFIASGENRESVYADFVMAYFFPLALRASESEELLSEKSEKAKEELQERIRGFQGMLTAGIQLWKALQCQRLELQNRIALRALHVNLNSAVSGYSASQISAYSLGLLPREAMRRALEERLRVEWATASLSAFGSSVNGFGGEGSDVDLILMLPSAAATASEAAFLQQAAGIVRETQDFAVIEVVVSTRVPVLKLLHTVSNTAIDVCVHNNDLPLRNTQLLRSYARYKQLHVLGMAVKCWARARGVNSPRNSTLSSYAWTLLVIFFCQQEGLVPNLQQPAHSFDGEAVLVKEDRECSTHLSAADLLLAFMTYYGGLSNEGFQFTQQAVSIRLGRGIPLGASKEDTSCEVAEKAEGWRFVIEDPFEPHDLGQVIREPLGMQHVTASSIFMLLNRILLSPLFRYWRNYNEQYVFFPLPAVGRSLFRLSRYRCWCLSSAEPVAVTRTE